MKIFAVALLLAVVVGNQGLENLSSIQNNQTSLSTEEEINKTDKHEEEPLEKRSRVDISLEATAKSLSKLKKIVKNDFEAQSGKRPLRWIERLKKDWKDKSSEERTNRAKALIEVVNNIASISNARDNHENAFRSVLKLITSIGAVTPGPHTQLVGIAAMFISSFLDLFGHSKKKPRSVRAIVREEVDAALRDFYDKTTKNEIDGVVHTITTLKSFVDRISKYKDRMSKSDLNNLKSKVPIFKKTHYLGKLRGQIKAMIKENKPKDARKCLAYLEILLKLETLRDMLFIQLASLSTSTGVSNTYYETVFEKQERIKPLLSFLYDRSKMNYITTYFDSHQYPQTNAYMQLILKMQRPEKFPAPKYCISNGNTVFDWFINQRAHVPLTHPIFGTSFERVCIWRIVSHGHNLFSIVNKYVCPNDPWCNALLSYDGAKWLDKLTVATVEKEDPVLWEIKHLGGHNYRIMPKSFCGKKCGQALGYSRHRILTHYVFAMPILVPQYAYRTVGCLGCPSNIWKIYEPSSYMPSYNESSVKDDNGSKPELVSEEEMNERIGNSSTRGEDGNSTLEKESDEMEENDRSDLGKQVIRRWKYTNENH